MCGLYTSQYTGMCYNTGINSIIITFQIFFFHCCCCAHNNLFIIE